LVGGPSKYMVGTEQGSTLSCNRRGKTPADKINQVFNGHHGPVYSVMRNTFFPKIFLTAGDWTTRIWCDEVRTPMYMTFYHKTYLTSATWHPVRPGVFCTSRMDGTMDVWDLLYKQSSAVLSVQVSDYALHTLRVQQDGKLVAVGSVDGSTSLLELSSGLSELARDEKNIIGQMFDREVTRDKNLIQRAREAKQRRRKSSAHFRGERDIGNIEESALKELSENFLKDVKREEEVTNATLEEKRKQRAKVLAGIDASTNILDEILSTADGAATVEPTL
jgi:dynein intermediate chain 2